MFQDTRVPVPSAILKREGIQMAFSTAGGGPFSTGPKMNVTPLIDVLLVLIIVFMLVVIEQKPVGLQTEIPQQPKSTDPTIPPPQTTIVIQIHHAKPDAGSASSIRR